MSPDIFTFLMVSLLVSCAVVFVVVLVLLPYPEELDSDSTTKQSRDKYDWAGWGFYGFIIWASTTGAVAFFVDERFSLVLAFGCPLLFLFYGIRLGFFAYKFKISNSGRTLKEPEDLAEARRRLGID